MVIKTHTKENVNTQNDNTFNQLWYMLLLSLIHISTIIIINNSILPIDSHHHHHHHYHHHLLIQHGTQTQLGSITIQQLLLTLNNNLSMVVL